MSNSWFFVHLKWLLSKWSLSCQYLKYKVASKHCVCTQLPFYTTYLFPSVDEFICLQVLLKAHQQADTLLPVYCFDPRHYQETYHHCFPKTGRHRAHFIVQSIQNLRQNLQAKGRYVQYSILMAFWRNAFVCSYVNKMLYSTHWEA